MTTSRRKRWGKGGVAGQLACGNRSAVAVVPWRGAPRRTARCRRTLLLLLAVASSARRRWPDARLPTQPLQAKAIQRLIEALCSELRGVAVPLVDSFAIPDHILRAPHRPQVGLVLGCVRCWGAAGVARGGCGALFKRFPMQEDTGLAVSDGRSSGTCFAVLQTAMGRPLPVPPRLAELKLHSAPALPAVLPPLPPPRPPCSTTAVDPYGSYLEAAGFDG